MTKNADLAYRALDTALANPLHLEMRSWFEPADDRQQVVTIDDLIRPGCGTTACFAGWAIALAGYGLTQADKVVSLADGAVVGDDIADFAADLLGVDMSEAHTLFFNREALLPKAVAKVFGPRPEMKA